jgi:hypothetical protein
MGAKRNAYMILVGKPKGERPLGRPRRRWVVNTAASAKSQNFEAWETAVAREWF